MNSRSQASMLYSSHKEQLVKYHKKILSTIGEVTSGHFAEMLIATVVNGDVVDSVGYDIKCEDGRLIEVRSRVEGTDSKTPRVTLTSTKMKNCTDVVAFRFNLKYEPIEVKLVPKMSLEFLFKQYLQNDGKTAHINWAKFCGCSGAVDLLPQVKKVFQAL